MQWAQFSQWLRTNNAFDFLDGAVLGSLMDNEVMEVLEDFNIPWTPENKKKAAEHIEAAIQENY